MGIEAMKQALEALERSVATCFDQYSHQQVMSQPAHFINQAITSLRQAIAEAEKQEPVAVYGYCPECGAKGVMRERRPNGNDKCSNGHVYPSSKSIHPQPAQPKREWVGLTKNEVEQTLIDHKMGALPHRIDCIRAIEAKLKEKNT